MALGVLIAAATACANDASCSEGQVLQDGACVPKASGQGATGGAAGSSGAAGAAGAASASSSAGAGGSAGAACTAFEFGQTCSDAQNHTDCGCAADYCAVQPGNPTGYCTATGCKEDPSVCPAGWSCLDLAAFDPSLPSICRAP